MERYGQVIRLRPEKYEEYVRLHADVWPGVLEKITGGNIQNYSIYYFDGLLFSYFEYIGDDFEADMAEIAVDPTTQEWWKLTDPCQEKVDQAMEGEWWHRIDEVFHRD